MPLLFFATGILVCQWLPDIPVLPWGFLLLGCLSISAGLGYWRWRWHGLCQPIGRFGTMCLMLFAFLSGVSYLCWRSADVLRDELPVAAMGRNLQVIGLVESLPDRTERGQRFLFRVESVAGDFHVPELIQLSVWQKNPDGEPLANGVPDHVLPGERWALTVRLKRPHGLANPHGYDYEARLFEMGVRATGYIRAGELLDPFVATPMTLISRLRYQLRERFEQVLPAEVYPNAGILTALAIGDQKSIPGSMWQVFAKTGTTHLMSISGLHVTLFSGFVAILVSWFWRRQTWLVSRIPAQRAGVFCGWFAAAFYTLVAGAGIPALRTLFMLTVGVAAMLTGRRITPFRILLLALVVVLLFDPWAGMSPGFWLSFMAVGLLLWAALAVQGGDERQDRLFKRIGHWVRGFGRTQWAVTIGTLPVLLMFFSQFSLISPLTNALAIPWVSGVVTPLTILALIIPWDGLLLLADGLLSPLMQMLVWSASLPIAVWHAPAPSPTVFALALLGALWWLMPMGWPGRWLAFFLCLPLIWPKANQIPLGEARVEVLDVGQGLAVLIRTHAQVLLYDTGPYYSGTADAGDRVIVPYLRATGVKHLDGMIVTHRDTDHSGGAISVLESMPVGWVADAPDTAFGKLFPGALQKPCLAGTSWIWDGVRFEFLHPVTMNAGMTGGSNSDSCVLRVNAGARSILLTSDIESSDEAGLLGRGLERSDVLLVPHHGSGTSSTAAFLEAVNPEVAIVPVGYRNRYRHPKPEVISAYEARKIKIYRTDTGGMIQVDLPAMTVKAYRESRRRYWMDQPGGASD